MVQFKTAIILAAGRGSRLKEMSLEQPKPMTPVYNTTIIDNLIKHLINNQIEKIVVVLGYMADKLKQHLLNKFENIIDLIFVLNDIYDKTNNIYSLWLAKDYITEGFYLFEADVFCEKNVIKDLVETSAENIILIDKFDDRMNGTVVELDKNSSVSKMHLKKDQEDNFDYSNKYKTVNFYKISKNIVNLYFLNRLNIHINTGDVNSYYELIIKEAIDKGYTFYGLKTQNNKWWEIDTPEDLKQAEEIFRI